HAQEFARLRRGLGLPESGVGRAAQVRETAAALGATVLLKGAETLVTSGSEVIAVTSPTHWLAVAGTGDVLAGVLGAVLAANPDAPLDEAAATAVWLHGHAAARAAGADDGAPG